MLLYKKTFLFIEFASAVVFLLLPPLFSAVPFTLPPKPSGLYAQCMFCFSTMCAAAYEEMLYRLYTPNRLHFIYINYIECRLRRNPSAAGYSVHAPLSPFPHVCCGYNTADFFELCFTEFPGLLLFTLAHRYLGVVSMLFAAGAGAAFRIAYLTLKRVLHPAASIISVAAVHGWWNIGVYYYLWGHSVTV